MIPRLTSDIIGPGVHHIPLDIHGFKDVPNYSMNSDFRIPPKKSNKKHKKPLYRPPPVLTEYKPPVQPEEPLFPEYRHQFPEETNTDFNIDKVHQRT